MFNFLRRFQRKNLSIPDIWLFDGHQAKSGVTVTPETALKVSAVLACARVIAEGVAQLPLKLFRETGLNSKEPARDHSLYSVLHRRPNEWMTSFEFRETLTFHAVLTGNGRAVINRAGGRVRELIPVLPERVTVEQDNDLNLIYKVRDNKGQEIVIPRTQMLDIRGPSWNSYLGMEPVKLARESIGLAISTEEHSARLHGNGARPGGILTTDGVLKDETINRLKESWQENFTAQNKFKVAVLDSGLKFQPMAMTGVDSQHIETRKFQIEEIARAFRVFPQMIMHSDKTSTYASAEQFFLAHVVHSLGPWLERWEQAIDRDLIAENDLFAKFLVTGLLRGDAKSRADFYESAVVKAGWMTRNEVRALEEMNPINGLDDPVLPMNIGPTDKGPSDADTDTDE